MKPMRAFLFLAVAAICTLHAQAPPAPAKLEVVLLGTGYPRPYPDIAGPATAVIANGKYFIVDAGRAVTLRLAAIDRPLPPVEAVLLTHLHSDHISGLPDLFATGWDMGRQKPLELYGPSGTEQLVEGLMKFYAADIHIRRDQTEMLAPEGAKINLHTVREGVVYKDAGVTVTAFLVDHAPVEPAFGYKFEAGGETVVISGDCAPSPNLVKFARGADILVHEVFLAGFFQQRERLNAAGGNRRDPAAVAQRLSRYHTDAEQAGEIAAEAGVKKLVFTHIIPPQEAEKMREQAARHFKGEIVAGKDLLRIAAGH